MRNLIAGAVVILLAVVALRMATALQGYRRGREQRRERLSAAGRAIVAEVPADDGPEFFAEDAGAFYWADRRIPKHDIRAARMLFGDVPLARVRARRFPEADGAGADTPGPETETPTFERAQWDVAIATGGETVVVACGAIREQVSQELARRIFEAVRQAVETCDHAVHHSDS